MSDEEPVDEHDDFCAVCGEHGDLLCCDICSRAFHTNCVYPPIRKAPKGDWSCQVCTGADSDLPKARRVLTIERERGIFNPFCYLGILSCFLVISLDISPYLGISRLFAYLTHFSLCFLNVYSIGISIKVLEYSFILAEDGISYPEMFCVC